MKTDIEIANSIEIKPIYEIYWNLMEDIKPNYR